MEVYAPIHNLVQRLLTGAVLVVVIASLVLAGPYGFLLLLLLINAGALVEFYRLFRSPDLAPRKAGGLVLSTAWLLAAHLVVTGLASWMVLLVFVPAAYGLFVAELYRKAPHPFHNLAFTFLGLLWITVPLLFFLLTGFLSAWGSYQPYFILGYFGLLWAADSGAYFAGKALGRHKLFERISPGKTWEGTAGGAVCALLVALALAWFGDGRNGTEWIVMAVLVLVTGTFGDLVKSMMKRSLHVKDSGTILPGHGGVLDRFDSLLGSAPFVFLYLYLSYA